MEILADEKAANKNPSASPKQNFFPALVKATYHLLLLNRFRPKESTEDLRPNNYSPPGLRIGIGNGPAAAAIGPSVAGAAFPLVLHSCP